MALLITFTTTVCTAKQTTTDRIIFGCFWIPSAKDQPHRPTFQQEEQQGPLVLDPSQPFLLVEQMLRQKLVVSTARQCRCLVYCIPASVQIRMRTIPALNNAMTSVRYLTLYAALYGRIIPASWNASDKCLFDLMLISDTGWN